MIARGCGIFDMDQDYFDFYRIYYKVQVYLLSFSFVNIFNPDPARMCFDVCSDANHVPMQRM